MVKQQAPTCKGRHVSLTSIQETGSSWERGGLWVTFIPKLQKEHAYWEQKLFLKKESELHNNVWNTQSKTTKKQNKTNPKKPQNLKNLSRNYKTSVDEDFNLNNKSNWQLRWKHGRKERVLANLFFFSLIALEFIFQFLKMTFKSFYIWLVYKEVHIAYVYSP